ncbi:CHL4 domain-containing protein [Lasiodiplodia theobromae]|nr:CHL4 domain-containing protein [Lasiodiplodia theobromae]
MSRKNITVPTNAALPHTQRLPADSPDVAKTLSRLSRHSLLELVLEWLDKKNREFCEPYLAHASDQDEDEDAPYSPATSDEEIVEVYKELKARKGGKREVVDRILEADWRHGITLYQLAMAETRYLLDHPNSLRWNALQLSKVTGSGGSSTDENIEVIDESAATSLPRFHATTFALNLQKEVAPVTKAHYYITRVKAFGISLLRVHIHDSPYNHPLPGAASSAAEGSKSVFLVFPDGSPYVYVSLATNLGQTVGVEGRSLRKVVVDAVPKALSRPHSRYALTTTSLSSRSLSTLLSLRGPGRSNAAPAGVNRRQSSDAKAGAEQDDAMEGGPFSGPSQLVEWKLKHGTFRPTLLALVRSNAPSAVEAATTEAFGILSSSRGASGGEDGQNARMEALDVLTKALKGVGPATASLVLACREPRSTPFFSDEMYRWMCWGEAKGAKGQGEGWARRIQYTRGIW